MNANDPQVGLDDIEDDGSLITEQPTVDASSTTTHARAQTNAIIRREQVREFWSRTLRDPVGGSVIWKLLDDLHVFEDERFAASPTGFPNPAATDHARGQRDFGLRLYRTLLLNDREALFALHDQFDPAFVKPRPPRKKRDDS